MRPFRLRNLPAAVFFLAAATSVDAAVVNLAATEIFYGAASACTTGVPVQVTAQLDPNSACTPSSGSCTESSSGSLLYPVTVCPATDGTSNGDFIKTTLPNLYPTSAYVVVEAYSSNGCAAATDITSITAYLADGQCHKTDVAASFIATMAADGSVTVLNYGSADCSAATTSELDVLASQTKGTCIDTDGDTFGDSKIYGTGVTSVILKSTVSFETTVGACSVSATVPIQEALALVTAPAGCSATTNGCSGTAAPYTSAVCTTASSYQTDAATAFGSTPYVIVESYDAGKNCIGSRLSGATVYLADGQCHKTGASAWYTATRAADGSVTVLAFTTSACTGSSTITLDASLAQVNGQSCANDANGVLDTKIYGTGVTTMNFKTTASFATSTDGCLTTAAVPLQEVMVPVFSSACPVTSSGCSGTAAPYTSAVCTTASSYQTDAATAFGSTPYVIVESYVAGKNCIGSRLSGATVYLADGQCHQTASAYYTATRAADGSVTVLAFTTSACTGSSTITLDASLAQVNGQSCASNANGVLDTKIYGTGVTTMNFKTTASFATSTDGCLTTAAVPLQEVMVPVFSSACPVTSSGCSGTAAPYTSAVCTTASSYQTDAATAFGSTPYVIVESYVAGKNCIGSRLSGATVYLADGLCHQTASAYYTATRAADGSVTVLAFTTSACTGSSTITLDASLAQVNGQSCANDANGIVDKKIYGFGVTPLYLQSTLTFETNVGACSAGAVPSQEVMSVVSSTGCPTPGSSCSGTAAPYTNTACSTNLTYQADVSTVFGSNPYVIVESYVAGKSCAGTKLSSVTVYWADGACHKTASAYYTATRAADGSATILAFSASGCTGSPSATTLDASAAQASGQSCANDGNGIVDKKIYGSGVTPLYLKSTLTFETNVGACSAGAVPSQEVMTLVSSSGCTATSACSGAGPYTSIACSTNSTYQADVATVFGTNPYVIVEAYVAGKSCAGTKLSSVTVYWADGACHKTASAYYTATRAADGSVTILAFSASGCTGSPSATTLDASAAQASGQSCANDGNGIVDKKIYGSGVTPLYLKSTLTFETNAGACSAGAVPSQEVMTLVSSSGCTATSACSGAGPYTSIACSTNSTYQADVATVFGTNPYVIVEAYVAGKSCAGTKLSSVTVYWADGMCHKTASAYYTATRAADGSVTILAFSASGCTGSPSATTLDASAAQANGQSCASDGNGIVDKKIYGSGATPLYLKSTLTFETNAGACSAGAVPSQEVMTLVSSSGCTATSACSGAGPYTSIACSTNSTYQADVATVFGTNPYVIVEAYVAGKSCAGTKLSSVTVYWADGMCHKTGASAYYTATRAADGSVTILAFTTSGCTGSPSATTLDASAAQANGQSCASDGNGIVDKKIYGSGATPLYLKSTLTFETNVGACSAGAVPSQEVMTLVSSSGCTATSACSGAGPYTSIACSTNVTYQANVATIFGTNPYVIVESYASGKSCDGTKLSSVTVYWADGMCHKTGASAYYIATRAADGSVTILAFTTSGCTGSPSATTLDASAAQANGQSCASDGKGVLDKKIYGAGATSLVLKSIVNFDAKSGNCLTPVGVPSLEVMSVVSSTGCTATTNGCTGTAAPYTSTVCSSASTYKTDVGTAFGTNPYVIVESYTPGKRCDGTKLSSITVYSADGVCHKTSGTSSYTATRGADGSATVSTYTAKPDCSGTVTPLDVTAAQAKNQSCSADDYGILDSKIYGAGVTTLTLKSIVNFDTNAGSCSPLTAVPSLEVLSVVSSTGCTPSLGACSGTAAPYTSTLCTSTSTYKTDVGKAFGSKPYVIVESYVAGKSCDGTKLSSITVYSADGVCHKTSGTSSYTATRGADGSATVSTYTAKPDCSGTVTPLDVTAAQAKNQSCSADDYGILDSKIYGAGVAALSLKSIVNFDTNVGSCSAPTAVPSLQLLSVVSSTGCAAATNGCTGTVAPYTSTVCTSLSTYQTDIGTAFGTNPYVIVESYTPGKRCDGTKLSGVTVYLADNVCHKTSASSSYSATRGADGSATVQSYSTAGDCTGVASNTLNVTVAQALGQSCAADDNGILDAKIYGGGATPTVLSGVGVFDGATCGAPAAMLTMTSGLTCKPADCAQSGNRSFLHACPDSDVAWGQSMFGNTAPFVIVELYKPDTSCGVKIGVNAYPADAQCHAALEGVSSFQVTLATSGDGSMVFYQDTACTSSPLTIALTSALLSSHECVGNSKYYAVNAPTVAPTVAPTITPAPTTAPTPTPTTTANTGSEKSSAASLSSPPVQWLVLAMLALAALLL